MPSITGDEFSCFGRQFLNRKKSSPHLVQGSRIWSLYVPLIVDARIAFEPCSLKRKVTIYNRRSASIAARER